MARKNLLDAWVIRLGVPYANERQAGGEDCATYWSHIGPCDDQSSTEVTRIP